MVEDVVWKDIILDLTPAAMEGSIKEHFTRGGSLASNLDIKTYDCGNLFVFTADAQNSVMLGKLWVEYDVTFFQPQLPAPGANTLSLNNAQGNSPNNVLGSINAATLTAGSIGIASGGANTYTFSNMVPGTEYLMNVDLTGTGLTAGNIINFFSNTTGTATASAVLVNSSVGAPLVNAAATLYDAAVTFVARAPNVVANLNSNGATISAALMALTQVAPGPF